MVTVTYSSDISVEEERRVEQDVCSVVEYCIEVATLITKSRWTHSPQILSEESVVHLWV